MGRAPRFLPGPVWALSGLGHCVRGLGRGGTSRIGRNARNGRAGTNLRSYVVVAGTGWGIVRCVAVVWCGLIGAPPVVVLDLVFPSSHGVPSSSSLSLSPSSSFSFSCSSRPLRPADGPCATPRNSLIPAESMPDRLCGPTWFFLVS